MNSQCQIKVACLGGEFEFVGKSETITVAAEYVTYSQLPNKHIIENVAPEWVMTVISKKNLKNLYELRNQELDLGKVKPNINYKQQKLF